MFILKYKEKDNRNETVWGYISNISQTAVKEIDPDTYVELYDKIPKIEEDPCEYTDGKKLPENIAKVNKIFSMVTQEIVNELGTNVHCENLIFDYESNYPIYAILLYIEDSKEFENILLLTDQTTYLLNEKGQTIERLV